MTTPLRKTDQHLTYENIDFEGPYWKTATESINIVTEGPLNNMSAPFSFSESGTNYNYVGPYNSRWALQFDAPELSTEAFSFNGKSYQLSPQAQKESTFNPEHIYLDINAGWTNTELRNIWSAVKDKSVFVYSNNKMAKVTEGNKESLFKERGNQNFTLFPFQKIDPTAKNLVISKYNQITPTLNDLKKSTFVKQASAFFNKEHKSIRVFNMGKEISPYLRTLGELRSIQLESGSSSDLLSLLQNNTFYTDEENDQTIVNHYGAFKIQESENDNISSNAPDHLMRLFVYNDVLREVGKDYFHKKALADDLIAAAKEAYVVTPISSLIVLETQKDYDRFNIKKSKNSLQNAAIGNSGAVPEPQEWLLILLVLGTVVYFWFFGGMGHR